MVKGACLLAVLIGRLDRHGTGLVGLPKGVSARGGLEFGQPVVQCESKATPDLLEEEGLAHPGVDVEELAMPIGELGGDQAGGVVKCA